MKKILLFDAQHYVKQLGERISADSAEDHYFFKGYNEGLCPNTQFDPVAYKISHNEINWQDRDPFQHFIDEFRRREKFIAPTLSKLFPDFTPNWRHYNENKNINLAKYDFCTPKQATSFNTENEIKLSINGNFFSFHAPTSDTFLGKINENRGFAVLKYPHGLWTTLRLFYEARNFMINSGICKNLNFQEVNNGAIRLIRQCLPKNIQQRDIFVEGFLPQIIEDMRRPFSQDLWVGVSFKGAPTLDNRVFLIPGQNSLNDSMCKAMADIFLEHFTPADFLYDGTLFKRWMISGALKNLPKLLIKHPVALVGPACFSNTGTRWKLPSYSLIKIPFHGSFSIRYNILKRVQEFMKEHGDEPYLPVIIFHCGGSLAAWLIRRLHSEFPNSMLWDFGQSLITWHLDEALYSYAPWMKIYKRALVENNSLETMYKEIAGNNFDEWLKG